VTDLAKLLALLADEAVAFIVVGGAAATAHGASRLTQDIDIVYDRAPENLDKIARALGPHRPYPRGAPAGLPFVFDAQTLRNGANFTLVTSLGDIDLLAEIVGGGGFGDLLPDWRS
jgi:hypothetical protein